jgi:16S rRNA (guanine966-N2)-methyltransferase
VSAPSGRAVRPTPARVKEALFSILGNRVGDARILDLFAGSGALGFEGLSRGAAHVTFVECHRRTAAALARTAQTLGVAERSTVLAGPADRMAARLADRYDIIFADPPYALPYPAALFGVLLERGAIDSESLVVYEHSSASPPPDDAQFDVVRTARYGGVTLCFLRAAA